MSARKSQSHHARPNARDPFARPPHPLGFNFLEEERPIRATKFQAILPTLVAKYGLGRRLVHERVQNAWRDALDAVFSQRQTYAQRDDGEENGKALFFFRNTKTSTLRNGTLRIEVASNLLYQELLFARRELLEQLQRRLPDDNLTNLKLVVK